MSPRLSQQRGSILLETGLAIGLIGLATVAAWRMIGDANHEQSVQHLGQYQQENAKTMIRYLRAHYLDPAWSNALGTPPAAPGVVLVKFDPTQANSSTPVYPQTPATGIARVGQDLLPLGFSTTGPRGSQSCTVVFGTDTHANMPLRAVMITHVNDSNDKDLQLAARIAGPTTGVVHLDGHGKLSAQSVTGGWAIDDLASLTAAAGPVGASCGMPVKAGDLVTAFAVTQSASGTPESALWRTRDAAHPQHNIIDTTESGENNSAISVVDPASKTVSAKLDASGVVHTSFIHLAGQGLVADHDSPLQTQALSAGTTTSQRAQFLPDVLTDNPAGLPATRNNTLQNPDGTLSLYADGFVGYTGVPGNSAQGLGGHHFAGVADGTGQGGLPGLSLNGFLQLGRLPDNASFQTISSVFYSITNSNNWYSLTDDRSLRHPKTVNYADLMPYQLGRTSLHANDYNNLKGTESMMNPLDADCTTSGIGAIMLIPNSPQVAICLPGPPAPSGETAVADLPFDVKTVHYAAPHWEFMMVLGTPYNPALLPRAMAWSTWVSRQQRWALPLLAAYAAGNTSEHEEPGTESALKVPEQYSKHGTTQHDDAYENDFWASAAPGMIRHNFISIMAEPDGSHPLDNMCDKGDGCTTATQSTGIKMK